MGLVTGGRGRTSQYLGQIKNQANLRTRLMCVCKQLKPEIQYLPVSAELFLSTAGRGSFIAPAVGFLHYGPSCYLYDHVCNFNYQGTFSKLTTLHDSQCRARKLDTPAPVMAFVFSSLGHMKSNMVYREEQVSAVQMLRCLIPLLPLC